MKESEPHFTVSIGGESIEARRNNSTLWTFAGKLAVFNHIFLDTDPKDPAAHCYVIRGSEKNFGKLMATMLACEYPAHLNMRELPDYVINNRETWNQPNLPLNEPPTQPPEWFGKLGEIE